MDKLKAIEAFIAVANENGFAAAARKLNISAPSITRLINELEADLGALLLHRTTRAVSLTDTGERYLEDSRAIFEELRCADDAARGAHSAPTGTLRVTASSMFGKLYITPIITKFLDQNSDVSVDALFLDRVVSVVDEGIDVAIRIGELQDSSFMASRVGTVQLQVCGSPDYFEVHGIPQTPADLLDHQTIGLSLGNFQSGWKFADNQMVRPSHRVNFNTIPAALNAAKAGWGLVRVLSYQIGPDLADGSLKSVLQDFAPEPVPIHVIHRQGRRASAKVRAFVDLAVETLRSNMFLN